MRGLGMCAALALALAGGSLVVAEAPGGDEFQRPGPGRGPAKPGEKKDEPAKDGEKKEGEAKEGEKKADAPAAPAAAEKWEEKKIEKLPDNDKSAQDALKKAWDSVYSAQAKGMKKLASDANMKGKTDLSAMGMGVIESDLKMKMAWAKGEGLSLKILEDAADKAAEDPMAGMMKTGMKANLKRFEQMLSFVIGHESFDDAFKGQVFVTESKDESAVVVRAWQKKGEEFVSTLYTITGEDVSRVFSAEANQRLEYTKKGRDKFLTKVSLKIDQGRLGGMGGAGGGQMPAGDAEAVFTFDSRGAAGEYQLSMKVGTTVKMMMVTSEMTFSISNAKVNDEVTQEMIDAAKDAPAKAAEAPAKEEKKPAVTGGGKAPAAGGEAKKPATGEGK